MTKIADIHAQRGGGPVFISDFSPPKGGHYGDMGAAASLDAHCLSVPYSPGKSVYANSAFAAHYLKVATGREAAFTLATRDMNILAAQSLLLGASLLDLQNVIVVRGDDFTAAELVSAKPVHDRTPTALIRSIAAMNGGRDFRGRALDYPTDFCIGAAIDTGRGLDAEVSLTHRKLEAGAHFFITQPGFSPEASLRFLEGFERAYGAQPSAPIFFGIQMVARGSRSFSAVPQWVRDELNAGVASSDIAIRAIQAFLAAGITDFYLMPPIFPGGARDYQSAAQVIERFKAASVRHP